MYTILGAYLCKIYTLNQFLFRGIVHTPKEEDTAMNELMKQYTFGIEIEFTGMNRKRAATVASNFFQKEVEHVGGTYDTYAVADNQGRTWKFMYDSSIHAQRKNGNWISDKTYKVEMVTPILHYPDIELLQELVRELRRAGGRVNDSTGLHIHVGGESFTPQHLRSLINIFTAKEDLLAQALNIEPARQNYCKKVNQQMVEVINKRKPRTLEEFSRIWYREHHAESTRNQHYNTSRYHMLNLHSQFYRGTIEYRLFNSTLHAGKVKAYIQMVLAITAQAQTVKYASPIKRTTDNPKYAFRCWMLRMDLIGDEYKTCRKHMLALLDGDSAWRNGAPK